MAEVDVNIISFAVIKGGTKVIAVHPDGNMDLCTKVHSNPSSGCLDISLKTKNVNLEVALKVSRSQPLEIMNACNPANPSCR